MARCNHSNAYKENVKQLVGSIDIKDSKVVLTSLHGTSLPVVSEILSELEYNNYVIETEQSLPESGSVAIINCASVSFANAKPRSNAASSSGFAIATVGKLPSGNDCSVSIT